MIVNGLGSRITVLLRIAPDEDNPYAVLSAQDEGGDALAEVKVEAGFKLNRQTAQAWEEDESQHSCNSLQGVLTPRLQLLR